MVATLLKSEACKYVGICSHGTEFGFLANGIHLPGEWVHLMVDWVHEDRQETSGQ